jgi:hypothetical protein
LIVDDIGYLQHYRDEMEMLFALLADQYGKVIAGVLIKLLQIDSLIPGSVFNPKSCTDRLFSFSFIPNETGDFIPTSDETPDHQNHLGNYSKDKETVALST